MSDDRWNVSPCPMEKPPTNTQEIA